MVVALAFLGFLALLSAIVIINSPQFKGKRGESKVRYAAERELPAESYHQFHNVTLATSYGTTQIDHIIVSRCGIFVIETKNMKGWIFGNISHPQWTQVIFNESYKFQNPLRQNYAHVKALESLLKLGSSSFHSMVVFVGDSTFKTPMPGNVRTSEDYLLYIQSFSAPIIDASVARKAVSQIQRARLEPSRKTTRNHVFGLKARSAVSSVIQCPRCGGSMVLRTAKNGFRAGTRFWGCSRYPACRGIVNAT
jgi:restriction system protein